MLRFAVAAISGAIAAGAAAALVLSPQPRDANAVSARAASPEYEIVYFGVASCIACKIWRRDYLPKWRASALSDTVSVIVLEEPTFKAFHRASFGSYGWLAAELRRTGKLNSTPTFVLLKDRKIAYVGRNKGLKGWERAVRLAEKELPDVARE